MNRSAGFPPLVEVGFLPAALLAGLDGTIEGNPGHDFRVNEVLSWPAHFPNSFIRFHPMFAKPLQKSTADSPTLLVRSKSGLAGLEQCVENFAVDIQLPLLVGPIADSHRLGIFITREPVPFPLRQSSFPG